ncbi:MAG TPA: c-type cytochrome domain-containing protein [Planctomycetota bacterium]|nr:c-type cytochrome domain-containing protein [Planctomycetota bacterium]
MDWPSWIGVFGRLHPLVVHLPIGFLLALLVLEWVAHSRGSGLPRATVSVVVWIAALSAVFTAVSGYALSFEEGYGTSTVTLHMRFGIAVAVASVVLAIVHLRASEGTRAGALTAYRVLLVITVLLVLPTGHLGGTITHGEDFLTAPFHEAAKRDGGRVLAAEAPPKAVAHPTEPAAETVSYARDVAPVFAARCTACHGDTKKKGGLSLKDAASVAAGGRNGPILVAGKPAESEIVRRLRLPAEDDDHMPPGDKPQPTADEIARIEKWIAAGAAFDSTGSPAVPTTGDAAQPARAAPAPVADAAPSKAIEALRAKLVHAETIAKDSNLLIISFSAVAKDTGDAEAQALLEPILAEVAELSLARSKITDASMALCARMPNLSRLDVRDTGVTDAGIADLAGHAQLAELVLARTHLSDAAVDALLKLPALKKVFVWNSGLSVQGLARLRLQRPELAIEAGAAADSKPLETEKDFVLAKPTPVNTVCPVTGQPVDPAQQVVFKGRLVGFCCPKCPAVFLADPAKYESKLP